MLVEQGVSLQFLRDGFWLPWIKVFLVSGKNILTYLKLALQKIYLSFKSGVSILRNEILYKFEIAIACSNENWGVASLIYKAKIRYLIYKINIKIIFNKNKNQLLFAFTFAPFSTTKCPMSSAPLVAAMWRGVHPSKLASFIMLACDLANTYVTNSYKKISFNVRDRD